ncbi:hypothetical protein FIU83_11820 [Halomonas sp. THAF5a]|nr:hypothetical protein FIU83_11820 [Halomonas sp. THAF5a]
MNEAVAAMPCLDVGLTQPRPATRGPPFRARTIP